MTTTLTEKELVQEAARVQLSRQDFAFYCSYVHGRPLFKHQEDWAWNLSQTRARTALICPPETYKSSTVRMFVEWSIGKDPDRTFLWVMNTATQAEAWVEAIEDTIVNNEKFHMVFPNVQPDYARGWTKQRMFVTRPNTSNPQPTLYGTGIDGPYQGMHVSMILLDDPTDQQDVASETKMAAQRDRLRGVLIDRLQEGGSFVTLMTRWGEADLHRDLVEMGFNVVQYPIENGRYPWGGRLLCPELFPDDRLQKIRETKGSALYALTYLCDPGAASGSMVKREWWKFIGETPSFDRRHRIHSWDLSIGKDKTADYCAFGHWAKGDDGYYLLDAGKWHLTFDERVKKMRTLYEEQQPAFVLVEDSTPSMDFIEYLNRHTRLPLKLVRPGSRDKVARLQAVLPLIEAGRVWLPSGGSWVNDFVDECAAFPGGAHDDQVDQATQALAFLEQRGGRMGRTLARDGVTGQPERPKAPVGRRW